MTPVAITQDDAIEQAITQALGYLQFESIIRGKIVAVKPNDTWASDQDKTAVTQPDTLRAVLRLVKQHNPKELIVTGGSGSGQTDEIFQVAGLMNVVKEEGASFFDHNRGPFQEVQLTYAPEKDVTGPQKAVMINPRILTYETLIVVSQLKMHAIATVTLSLKNIAMSFPAADYYGGRDQLCEETRCRSIDAVCWLFRCRWHSPRLTLPFTRQQPRPQERL